MKNCLVLSPMGDAGSKTRRQADLILKYVITPAVQSCGYQPIRADQISEPGEITSQIIKHIVEDPIVVADLTGSNPNVCWELGYRHALGKPVVQIIQKGEKIPFDIAGIRTIWFDHRDLDSVEEAKREIQRQIKSINGSKPRS